MRPRPARVVSEAARPPRPAGRPPAARSSHRTHANPKGPGTHRHDAHVNLPTTRRPAPLVQLLAAGAAVSRDVHAHQSSHAPCPASSQSLLPFSLSLCHLRWSSSALTHGPRGRRIRRARYSRAPPTCSVITSIESPSSISSCARAERGRVSGRQAGGGAAGAGAAPLRASAAG